MRGCPSFAHHPREGYLTDRRKLFLRKGLRHRRNVLYCKDLRQFTLGNMRGNKNYGMDRLTPSMGTPIILFCTSQRLHRTSRCNRLFR